MENKQSYEKKRRIKNWARDHPSLFAKKLLKEEKEKKSSTNKEQ